MAAADSSRLSAEDRFEIQDLLIRYTSGECRTEETFREICTDDVVLDGPRGSWRGLDGIRGFIEQYKRGERSAEESRGALLGSMRVKGDGDEATITASFVIVRGDPAEQPRPVVTGWYEAVARRAGGHWKLAKRVTHVNGVPLFRDTEACQRGDQWTFRNGEYVLEPAPVK